MAVLQVEKRTASKTADVKRLRNDGNMPMAIVSGNTEPRLIQASKKQLKEVLTAMTGVAMLDVSIDEAKPIKAVVKQIQRDPATRKVLHILLQEVRQTDTIKISIPIVIEGEPESVTQNESTMSSSLSNLEIQCKVSDIPEQIIVDASQLGPNDKISVADLSVPEGVTILTSQDATVVTTKPAKSLEEMLEPTEIEVEGEEGDGGEGAGETAEAEGSSDESSEE